MREFKEEKLVIASHNRDKKKEIENLLNPFSLKILSAAELGVPIPEETEATFEGNALLKARHCKAYTHLTCLADDSGLVVPALGGDPGIHSARWAETSPKGPRDFTYALSRLERELSSQAGIEAYMISVLCLLWPNDQYQFFEGRIYGTLVFPPRGTYGFGYDPVFQPHGCNKTLGELTSLEKAKISHRTLAFEKLVEEVFSNNKSSASPL